MERCDHSESSNISSVAAVPTTPVTKAVPPLNMTPAVHKTAVSTLFTPNTNHVSKIYPEVAADTRGHYLVGLKPDDFLNQFMPWNLTTTVSNKERKPPRRRVDALRSMAHIRPEKKMYPCFVSA